MFKNLRMDKKMALFSNVIFMVRRLALVIILTLSMNHPLTQIFIYGFLSSLALLYAIMVCPYEERLLNIAEITNEVFIALLAYHLCLMTDYVVDFETELHIGWSCIVLMLLNFAFNIIVFLIALVIKTRRGFKQWSGKRAVKKAIA